MSRRDEDRERRLAAALRDNLKRRKAQSRAEPPPDDIAPAVPTTPPAERP